MNKKVAMVIVFILLLIGILFMFNRYSGKQCAPAKITPAQIERPVVEKPVVEAPVAQEPKIAVKEQAPLKEKMRKKVFMGNRGFVIKDTKSTFIKYAILEELRKYNYYKEVIE